MRRNLTHAAIRQLNRLIVWAIEDTTDAAYEPCTVRVRAVRIDAAHGAVRGLLRRLKRVQCRLARTAPPVPVVLLGPDSTDRLPRLRATNFVKYQPAHERARTPAAVRAIENRILTDARSVPSETLASTRTT